MIKVLPNQIKFILLIFLQDICETYTIICLPGRYTVKLQHFFYPLTFLTIICMSLDSFSNLVPLAFIT